MKTTTEDIAWGGGTAKAGDLVDESTMEAGVVARWVEAGVLVEPGAYVAPNDELEPLPEPEPEPEGDDE